MHSDKLKNPDSETPGSWLRGRLFNAPSIQWQQEHFFLVRFFDGEKERIAVGNIDNEGAHIISGEIVRVFIAKKRYGKLLINSYSKKLVWGECHNGCEGVVVDLKSGLVNRVASNCTSRLDFALKEGSLVEICREAE